MKESIAIVGLPGSGKTVLWSVLASKFKDTFHPNGDNAWDFVDQEWQYLQHGKWQPPTMPLVSPDLMAWELHFNDKKYDIINCDVAGEDFRKFVSENHPDILGKPDVLTRMSEKIDDLLTEYRGTLAGEKLEHFKKLETQLKDAAAICVLLDLTADINEKQNYPQKRFVDGFLRYLHSVGNRKCAISFVVTKSKQLGGTKADIQEIVDREYRPLATIAGFTPDCLIVDAVADTALDFQTGKLLPKSNFHSEGLEELLDWLQQNLRRIDRNKTIRKWLIRIVFVAIFGSLCFQIPPPISLGIIAAVLLATIHMKLSLRHKSNQ